MDGFDTATAIKEADQYVRDHLLIQFMQSCIESGTPVDVDVEQWYDAWKQWLKEREAENAKGSQI